MGRLFRHVPSLAGPHLFRQLVLVFSRCLLQFCDSRLLLLHHGAQVLNAIVIWQLIFGHLQAAVQSGVRENRLFNRTCVLTASSHGQQSFQPPLFAYFSWPHILNFHPLRLNVAEDPTNT